MRGIFMVATPERRTQCVRIEPKNGEPIRIALAYPVDLKMSNGAVYQGGIYSQPTDISATLSGGPTVLDFGSVYDVDTITRDQIQSGYWDGARVYSFFTDWAYPVEDEEERNLFTLGRVREEDERYITELMGLLDKLNQNTGKIHTSLCSYTYADYHIDGRIIASDKSRCKKNYEDNLFSGVVTGIDSIVRFYDISFSDVFPDDWFGNGEIRFKTGENSVSGYRFIKSYSAGGVITINSPFYFPISVGDEFEVLVGCRKRHVEDCINKHGNGVRYGAYPHVPTISTVAKFGSQ